tara:strand:+ start:1454 stop:2059 length:606 start_codon:yes stop_codon:yes gene_type:complete
MKYLKKFNESYNPDAELELISILYANDEVTKEREIERIRVKKEKLDNNPELLEIYKRFRRSSYYVTSLEEEILSKEDIVAADPERDFKKETEDTNNLIGILNYLSKVPKVFQKLIDSLFDSVLHTEEGGNKVYTFTRFLHPMDNDGKWGIKLRVEDNDIHGEQRPSYFDVDKINSNMIGEIQKRLNDISKTPDVMKKLNRQ